MLGELFEKSSPITPQKLFKKKENVRPCTFSCRCVGEERTLFRRDFACGEISSRKKWGPLPQLLHNNRIALTIFCFLACRSW